MLYNCFLIRKRKIFAAMSVFVAVILSLSCVFRASGYFTPSSTNPDGEEGFKLTIIMYHQVTTSASLIGDYVVSVEQLESDFKYISEHGYTSITAEELYYYVSNGIELPENPIIITFDDGCESFYSYAYPLLQKYELKAVMSVVGSFADKFTLVEDHNLRYSCLNWDEIAELSDSGIVEIANHTYDMHSNSGGRKGAAKKYGESDDEYAAAITADIEKMQEETFNYTGKYPITFTFPYGAMSKNSRAIVADMGFGVIFTCEEKVNRITYDLDSLLGLGRYNRSGNYSTWEFFSKFETV